MRVAPVKKRLLAVSALAMSLPLVGCVRPSGSTPANTASRRDEIEAPQPSAAPEPASKRDGTDGDTSSRAEPDSDVWSRLPGEAPTGPLQAVFEQVAETLWRFSNEWSAAKGNVPPPDRQRQQVARALAPVIGLLRETWTGATDERPELAELEKALLARARHTRMPAVDGATTLGWFLVESAMDATGSKVRGDYAAWTLNALRWATSTEELYTTAFDALSPKFATVPDMVPRAGPWRYQPSAVAAVTKALKGVTREAAAGLDANPPDGTGVFGVRVAQDGRAGHVSLTRATALDLGSAYGAGNAQLDGSEVVRLALEFQRTGAAGTLFSESLVPVALPDCAVFVEPEAVFPEVPKYGVAVVGITVLSSGRCLGEQQLRLAARSSNGEATELVVTLTPRGEPRVGLSLRKDGDLPGSSVAHDSTRGLVPGATLELLPTLSGPSSSELALRKLTLAFAGDEAIATLNAPRLGSTRAAGGFVLDDDADLRIAPKKEVRAVIARRDPGTLFGSDPRGLWLTSELLAQRARIVEPAAAARDEKAESWLGEHLPADVDLDTLLRKVAADAGESVSSVRTAFGDVDFLDPTVTITRDAFTRLLEKDLLREPELLNALLDRFELPTTVLAKFVASQVEKRGASSPAVPIVLAHLDARAQGPAPETPEAAKVPTADRKLARNLVIAEVATSELEPEVARRVLDELGFLKLKIPEGLNAVHRAVTVGLLVHAFKLEQAPDAELAAALTEFVARYASRGVNGKATESESRLLVGAVLVRRWTRLPIAVDAVGRERRQGVTPRPEPAIPAPSETAVPIADNVPAREPALPSVRASNELPSHEVCALGFGPRVAGMGPMSFAGVGVAVRPPSLCDLEAAFTVGYQQLHAEALVGANGARKKGIADVVSHEIPLLVRGTYRLGGEHAFLLDGGAGVGLVFQDGGTAFARSGVVGLANAGIGYGFIPSIDRGLRFSATAGTTFLFNWLPGRGETIGPTVESLLIGTFLQAEDGTTIGPYGELSASYFF